MDIFSPEFDQWEREQIEAILTKYKLRLSPNYSGDPLAEATAAITRTVAIHAWHQAQLRTVLVKLKEQAKICYDCQHDNPTLDDSVPYVPVSAIDELLGELNSFVNLLRGRNRDESNN